MILVEIWDNLSVSSLPSICLFNFCFSKGNTKNNELIPSYKLQLKTSTLCKLWNLKKEQKSNVQFLIQFEFNSAFY